MKYQIKITKSAIKDKDKIKSIPALKRNANNLIEILEINPYQNPPSYEKLTGLNNVYSRRINRQHRLVYEVYDKEKIVKIISMWTHYE